MEKRDSADQLAATMKRTTSAPPYGGLSGDKMEKIKPVDQLC